MGRGFTSSVEGYFRLLEASFGGVRAGHLKGGAAHPEDDGKPQLRRM